MHLYDRYETFWLTAPKFQSEGARITCTLQPRLVHAGSAFDKKYGTIEEESFQEFLKLETLS